MQPQEENNNLHKKRGYKPQSSCCKCKDSQRNEKITFCKNCQEWSGAY